MELMMVFNTLSLLGALIFFVHLYNVLVRKPERLRAMLRKQGISGPRPTFLLGNMMEFKKALSTTERKVVTTSTGAPVSHNCAATIFPFLEKWRKQYGNIYITLFNSVSQYIYRCVMKKVMSQKVVKQSNKL